METHKHYMIWRTTTDNLIVSRSFKVLIWDIQAHPMTSSNSLMKNKLQKVEEKKSGERNKNQLQGVKTHNTHIWYIYIYILAELIKTWRLFNYPTWVNKSKGKIGDQDNGSIQQFIGPMCWKLILSWNMIIYKQNFK